MKVNVGTLDRIIRLIAGSGLIILTVYWRCWICGVLGLILIFTAILGWCGIYKVFGISTCKVKIKK